MSPFKICEGLLATAMLLPPAIEVPWSGRIRLSAVFLYDWRRNPISGAQARQSPPV